MKFLGDEWFEAHRAKLNEVLTPGKASAELVEVYSKCYGTDKVIWVYYLVEKGVLVDLRKGEGLDTVPKAAFRGSGTYADYVASAKGELDPVKALTAGRIKLEGNVMKGLGMVGTYNKMNAAKVLPGTEF